MPYIKEGPIVVNAQTTSWTAVPFPTPGWAHVVFPELPPDEALDRLWEEVIHTLRLDEPDPIAAWHERMDTLIAAGGRLTERRFDAIHLKGPGTDLTVGLLPARGGRRPTSRRSTGRSTTRTCRPRRSSRPPTPSGWTAS